MGGELTDLQKRRTGVEKTLDPLARQQLAPRCMPLARGFRTAERRLGDAGSQLLHEGAVVGLVGLEGIGADVELRGEDRHAPINSRPIRKRRISLVPAPMS